jgi:hypothetical protein
MSIVSVIPVQKIDRMESVLRVLDAAQKVYGIKTNIEASKIAREKAKQEKMLSDEKQAKLNRDKDGLVNQEEYDQLYIVPDGTPGSRVKWINETLMNKETNQKQYNQDGTPKTVRRMFSYMPKDQQEGEARSKNLSQEDIKLRKQIARSQGLFSPEDLIDQKVIYQHSFTRKPEYREGKVWLDEKQVPFWFITPEDLQAKNIEADNARANAQMQINKAASSRLGDQWKIEKQLNEQKIKDIQQKAAEQNRIADNKAIISDIDSTQNATGLVPSKPKYNGPLVIAPEFLPENKAAKAQATIDVNKLNPSQRLGYYNAQANGIANPSALDIDSYNPEKISKEKVDIKNELDSNKVPAVVAALKNIQSKINIDDDSEIPGYGGSRWAIGQVKTFGAGDKVLNKKEIQLRNAIDDLKAQIKLMRSGQAVSKPEMEAIDRVLGTDLFSSSESLKSGMRTVRDVTKKVIQNIESPYYGKPSLIEWKKNPTAIHSEIPDLSGTSKPKELRKKQFSPNASTEEKMDDFLGR